MTEVASGELAMKSRKGAVVVEEVEGTQLASVEDPAILLVVVVAWDVSPEASSPLVVAIRELAQGAS